MQVAIVCIEKNGYTCKYRFIFSPPNKLKPSILFWLPAFLSPPFIKLIEDRINLILLEILHSFFGIVGIALLNTYCRKFSI